MSNFDENRVSRRSSGTSAGGQFAHKGHRANDEVGLEGDSADWPVLSPRARGMAETHSNLTVKELSDVQRIYFDGHMRANLEGDKERAALMLGDVNALDEVIDLRTGPTRV